MPPPPGAKAFLLVTDNRRSRLDSEELIMQLSQTLSSAIAQIKVSNIPITNHTKKILPQRPLLFSIVLMGEGFSGCCCS